VAQQRRIAQQGSIVMVGRDIGTVVLPEAELKIYLDAKVDERARRRYREIVARRTGEAPQVVPVDDPEYLQIREVLAYRDRIDSSRQVAPLRAAQDAIVVDSTEMSIEQVLEHVLALVGGRP
jgi:cytidylate kinase